MVAPTFASLCNDAESVGLVCRGGFHPDPQDFVPACADGSRAATVVLFGFVGSRGWPTFAASAERADGRPDALDRWSQRVIDAIGARTGAIGLYPSHGPPWLPFQRWALRAESLHFSPLGILIHPDFGLWHAYRGALAFQTRLALPEPVQRPSPCSTCIARPCLSACPVAAFQPDQFDRRACAGHVAATEGADCLQRGCRARRSCPVGADHRYAADQANFHMAAFLRGSVL